jgi:hypothetical protein
MSIYYSRFGLNTYRMTPYFEAQLPAGYPVNSVLQKCRAFRRLPPNLKTLSALAKRWYDRKFQDLPPAQKWEITDYYDAEGNELNADTGQKLTDAEIDAKWLPNPGLDTFVVTDIPAGPFADPDTWEPPKVKDDDAPERPSKVQLLTDIVTHGRRLAAEEYGLTDDQLPIGPFTYDGMDFDEAKAHFAKRVAKVLASPYFSVRKEQRAILVDVLQCVDLYDDLWGQAEDIFDRAEADALLAEETS